MNIGNSIRDIDARLEKDLKAYNKKQRLLTTIGIILLLIVFRNTIMFNLKFACAFVSGQDNTPINVKEEPLQIDYPKMLQEQNTFVYTSLVNGHRIKIIPQAYYKISGMVVAHNHTFIFRNDFFDSAALYDIGIVWGPLANKKIFKKYFKCYSDKNELSQARVLYTSFKSYETYKQFKKDMPKISINNSFSHSHLVPENRNVMAALLKIKDWSEVEIEGQLIDMEYKNKYGYMQEYRTSTSRTDNGNGNRGYGACETILVRSVKIGNKVYR